MSSNAPSIAVRGLSKSYRIRHQASEYATIAEVALSRLRHPLRSGSREVVWALDDVSFDVYEGEAVGIIGRNGAGKTTLLRLLTRITEPTGGEIDLWGRVGSLLEVGTGFHPELTGRENIHLNGSILGMSRREITTEFDNIVEFAGVEKFLDTPVKRYSSGMHVRLAFAVAAHLRSEILLLDEVLAVGDADFQARCLEKLSQLSRDGRTVLLVSHSPQVVRTVAPRSLLLRAGRLEADGPTDDVLAQYATGGGDTSTTRSLAAATRGHGLGVRARFRSIALGRSSGSFPPGEVIDYVLEINAEEDFDSVALSLSVHTPDGTKLGSSFSSPLHLARGSDNVVQVSLPPPPLAPGRYFLSVGLGLGDNRGNTTFLDIVYDAIEFEMEASIDPDKKVERWDSTWGPLRFPPTVAERVEARSVSNA